MIDGRRWMGELDHITVDARICMGQRIIRGMSITFSII
jgi:uncharacterized protein (DUF433 family)